MKDFVTAATKQMKDGQRNKVKRDPKKKLTFKIDDVPVTFYEPAPGQAALMMTMTTRELDMKAASLFIQLFFDLMDEETNRHLQARLLDATDPFELDSEGGIFDIWHSLMEEWSGKKATKSPQDYQPPRRATGNGSTASSRAKESTSSRSRSRASST